MTIRVALLRGVNVGGNNKLPMAEFRDLLTGLGFGDVASYIQSGNAVFRAQGTAQEPAMMIRAAIDDRFGFETDVFVLSRDELETALVQNPFAQAGAEPTRLHIFFLQNATKPDMDALQAAAKSGEEFRLSGKVFWFYTPNGMGRSALAAKLPRFFDTPITGRNLRTCQKLLSLAQDL
jgi:uncharacterized protein (DUF1697 family)